MAQTPSLGISRKLEMTFHLHGPISGNLHEDQIVFCSFKKPFAEERACLRI